MKSVPVGCPTFGGNEARYVADVMETGWLTAGHYVKEFERRFAEYIGVKHAVTTTSGTTALTLALAALGIGPGDEVIVPALTFVATANAVRHVGAKPVIVDVNPNTWIIATVSVVDADNERVKAVIPVSLFGLATWETGPILPHIPIIDDACEALGAEFVGRRAGDLGLMSCFSFYGNKTITTGEGGMVTTNDDTLAARLRSLRSECTTPTRRYWHTDTGYNFMMTDIQAAVGCGQMEVLPAILERRAQVAEIYRDELGDILQFQSIPDGCTHGNWMVVGLLPASMDRDKVMGELSERGIETRPMFPPLNTMPMYKDSPRCPVAERIAPRGIMLPTHAELSDDDMGYICDTLKELVREHSRRRRS